MLKLKLAPLALVLPIALNGCGLYVPEKGFLSDDAVVNQEGQSRHGQLESDLVLHIKCEIQKGLWRVATSETLSKDVPWLLYKTEGGSLIVLDKNGNKKVIKNFVRDQPKSQASQPPTSAAASQNPPTNPKDDPGWGASVYLQVQVDEQTQLNPGVGVVEPFHNAYSIAAGPNTLPLTPASLATPTIGSIPQSFNVGIGVAASAHATRLETIQFTLSNFELLGDALANYDSDGPKCDYIGNRGSGVMINSNLKIDDFIYDHASSAAYGNFVDETLNKKYNIPQRKEGIPLWLVGLSSRAAPYNTFQEIINFSASYGGGVTPTWKFARASVNPNTPTAAAQRSEVNTLIITLGELGSGNSITLFTPKALTAAGQTQHQAAAQAALIGSANKAITP